MISYMYIYIYMLEWVPKKSINTELVASNLAKSAESNQFTNGGPCVKELELFVREKFGVDADKAVVAVTNGSVALHILSSAIEVYRGKNLSWATQAFTFPPSAQGNLGPGKIIDVDEDGGLSLSEIRDETIDGIIVTNVFGNIVNVRKYTDWARDNNKILVFDNAATAITFYKGKNAINYGHGSTISFHHTKPFGFGEGGAIICDKVFEKNVRCLINFGIGLSETDYFHSKGNNGKMSDISAAFILQYLQTNFDLIVKHHRELYRYLTREIARKTISHFRLFTSFHDAQEIVPACFALVFEVDSLPYIDRLLKSSIYCRRYYHPLKATRNATNLYRRILCFPCTIDMTTSDIDIVLRLLAEPLIASISNDKRPTN